MSTQERMLAEAREWWLKFVQGVPPNWASETNNRARGDWVMLNPDEAAQALNSHALSRLRAAKESGHLGHKEDCESLACEFCNEGRPLAKPGYHSIGTRAFAMCLKQPCSCGFAEKGYGDL